MNWVLLNLLPQGTTVQQLQTCRTSCRPTCCVPLRSWYAETATCRLWSHSTMAPTTCWPAVGTGSALRSATGPTPSPPVISSPAPQSGHLPLAGCGATADTPGCACGFSTTISPAWATACASRCKDTITTWAGARNLFFIPSARGLLYSQVQWPATPVRLDLLPALGEPCSGSADGTYTALPFWWAVRRGVTSTEPLSQSAESPPRIRVS
jgi:hypothetical protein